MQESETETLNGKDDTMVKFQKLLTPFKRLARSKMALKVLLAVVRIALRAVLKEILHGVFCGNITIIGHKSSP